MFAKNRVGFMPGLFVAFLDELTPEEKSDFLQLPSETARAGLVLGHAFIRDKFSNISGLDAKSEAKAARAREEGNREFQAGNFRSTLTQCQQIFSQNPENICSGLRWRATPRRCVRRTRAPAQS